MFDNLTPESEAPASSEAEKKPDTLGQGNNIPANLASTFGSGIGSGAAPKPVNPGLGEEFDQRMQKLQEKGKKRGIKFSRIGMIVGSIIGLVMMGVVYYLLTDVIGYTEKAQESSVNIPAIGRENKNEKKDKVINLQISSEMLACQGDDDCIAVQAQCCPCDKGGVMTAINKNFQSAWDEEFNNKCTEAVCEGAVNCPSGRAFCDGLQCRFVEVEELIETASGTASTTDTINPAESAEGAENTFVENTAINDIDQDGLTDADEMELGTDLARPDTDGDGILDGEEIKLKINPNMPDTDGDGIQDKDELTLGTDPNKFDTDGDGYGDGSELINGYNPIGEGMLKRPNQ